MKNAEEELKDTRLLSDDAFNKSDFLRAAIISNKAVIRFANRFADLASEMASRETDPDKERGIRNHSENLPPGTG